MIVPKVSILGQYLQLLVLQLFMERCSLVLVGTVSLGSLAWTRVSLGFLLLWTVAKYDPSILKECCGVGSAGDMPVSMTRLVAGCVPRLSMCWIVSFMVGGFISCSLSNLCDQMRESLGRSSR